MTAPIIRDELGRFAGKMEEYETLMAHSAEALDAIARELAIEMLNLTRERFRRGTDPYGERWVGKSVPDGRGPLHGPTGRLKGGWFIASAKPEEILVRPAVRYAIFHQSDAPRRRLPRRMMIPDRAHGMPKEYIERFDRLVNEALTIYYGAANVNAARTHLGIWVKI